MLTALVVIFFGVNWQVLTGRVSAHWDGSGYFSPYYTYLAELTRSGHFLLWNPLSTGGSPDFAEPDVGVFSPVTLLLGLIIGPGPVAFQLYWLCLWLFGGLGMYVLARAVAAPPWGALLTSLAFVFSGFYLGAAEQISVIYTFSFVPWLLWRVRAAMTTGRLWPACQAGALWGLSALAGTPAVVIPGALFTGVIALAWLAARPGTSWTRRWRHYVFTMALVAVVGVLVLAPSYLSFRHEVAGYSHRTQPLARAVVLGDGLGFNWLATLASPMVALVTYHLPGWSSFDLSLLPIYFGSVLSVLALYTLWVRRREPWILGVAASGLLALGIAMGSTLPLREWLYDWVPFTRFFRHAPLFRGFFLVAVAVLAAHGTGLLEEGLRRNENQLTGDLRLLSIIAGVCALLAPAATAWALSSAPDAIDQPFVPEASLHVAIAWPGLVILCLCALRWHGFRHLLPVRCSR